ncbi:hypothetical protein [Nostoc sp.]|uniref:hypothetical protein n=1 Tax=Nostoc sp. TaxID=1180 RepID=UPI002FF98D44
MPHPSRAIARSCKVRYFLKAPYDWFGVLRREPPNLLSNIQIQTPNAPYRATARSPDMSVGLSAIARYYKNWVGENLDFR